jgi:hypothetical protein
MDNSLVKKELVVGVKADLIPALREITKKKKG